MSESLPEVSAFSVKRLLLAAFCTVLLIKVFFAYTLDLYSDEIFYWLASTHPALAYSDLPFMTALLIGLGTALGGDHAFAARSLFLIMGTSLPFLIYHLALPVTNWQQALESALLTLCLPLAGFLGLLAVPDVALLCFGVAALAGFERALRTNAYRYWVFTGLVVALGLSTHYRFFLYPLAAILYLLVFPAARTQWRNPGLWLAIAIACIGLIPVLWFNISNQLSSASFYFVDRHPWTFQVSGLLHILKQAGLVSPLLYGLLIYTIWVMLRKARTGDATAALFSSFALTNVLIYMVLAPWTDATSTSIHWPLSGYMPLLVYAPGALRELFQIFQSRWNNVVATRIALSVPILGFCGTLIALFGVGSQAFQLQLQPILGTGVLSNKMAGWKEFGIFTRDLINERYQTTKPVIVTDNYYTAAQVEFAGLTDFSFTLDQSKAVNDGRIAQLLLWEKDASGLLQHSHTELLLITEDSTLDLPDKFELMRQVCEFSSEVSFLDHLSLFNGDKQFSFYAVSKQPSQSTADTEPAFPCPLPAEAWLDMPQTGQTLSGMTPIAGWAFNEDIGVNEIFLLVDGVRQAQLPYGNVRTDVVVVKNIVTDPRAPAIGFDYLLDTSTLVNGRHELQIEVVNNLGIVTRHSERTVTIRN